MKYYFKNLMPLYRDMLSVRKSLEHFELAYNKVQFDIILDIGSVPFQMMIGAKHQNLAFVLELETGFATTVSNDIYYQLIQLLDLNYKDNGFTSYSFLKYIDSHVPASCDKRIMNPDLLLRFRPYHHSDPDEACKTRFYGWNDHTKDNKQARNFSKTERYLGKAVADFCRAHNISSLWTTPNDTVTPRDIDFPPGYYA